MATTKQYSVARTNPTANASTVYSIAVDPTPHTATSTAGSPGESTGSNSSYHRIDEMQMREGKIPTLTYSFANPGGNAPTGVCGTGHAVFTNANVVAGTARPDLASTTVIATTTTITNTAGNKAAGLVVRVPVDANGAITRANVRAVIGGEDYADGTIVSVDGWVGSRFTIDVAA